MRNRLVLLVMIVVLGLLGAALPAGAGHAEVVRLSAGDNVHAAIAISQAVIPDSAIPPHGSRAVLLGRDDQFADSLASGSLQAVMGGLLLTSPDSLHPDTAAEIERLRPNQVFILGGNNAISPAVEEELRSRGYETNRFSGPTRIETAIAIARSFHDAQHVFLARAAADGDDPTRAFADSLALGAAAAYLESPILLTQSDRLTDSTKAYIQERADVPPSQPGGMTTYPLEAVTIVGGAGAVSTQVETELRQMGLEVNRVSGPNRFETAVALAIPADAPQWGFSPEPTVVLAEGQAPDAWAPGFASAIYGSMPAPVVLTNGTTVPDATERYLSELAATYDTSTWHIVCAPYVQDQACDRAAAILGLPSS